MSWVSSCRQFRLHRSDHGHRACTDQILAKAIARYGSRSMPIEIPKITQKRIHGFTHEYIECMLGGTFRGSYSPLNDNIINGRIRGVAGVVGCTNPRSNRTLSMWPWSRN